MIILDFNVRVFVDETDVPSWLDVQRTTATERSRLAEIISKEIAWNLTQRQLKFQVSTDCIAVVESR